ncbi:MAG: DNA topoisomerase-1 [Candidatus Deianiraeaceae bacterium]
MKIVVVESPAKSKTITSYLGKGFKVVASFGHIRDLPSKQGSVDIDNNFEMDYQISSGSTKTVNELVKEIKGAETLYLATDPDREGEAISWHVQEVLKKKKALPKDVKRITFNQITKSAILHAVANPREIDQHLVEAQQTRLALDYLMGFNISPVLWRKLPGSKSAGRVQSVALRITCDKEKEIEAFKIQEYWSITAQLEINKHEVPATLEAFNGNKLEKFSITNEKQAQHTVAILTQERFTVDAIQTKETKRRPYAPFTTSTLQQESASKLYFSPKRTMQIAQGLYEGVAIGGETKGLITYMRTDSISISNEGMNGIRKYIETDLKGKYLPSKPIFYASKQKNAQEAHEAIRPTDAFLTPEKAKKFLKDDQFKLYNLIWRRAVASQVENAVFEATKVTVKGGTHTFKINGSTIKFDGFLKIYNFGLSEDTILPQMQKGDNATPIEIKPNQHFTQPPARYTEATLIKQLEEKGIGRPSTYANIISVIQERSYVKMNEQKRLEPELRGRVVNCFLEKFFSKYVEYDFTATLEDDLDAIAEGKNTKLKFLQHFWQPFKQNVDEAMKEQYEDVVKILNEELSHVVFKTDEDGVLQNQCPLCKEGSLGLKLGKFGLFSSCSSYPECKYIMNPDSEGQEGTVPFSSEGKHIGDYDTKKYYLKKGPYGLYVEIQSPTEKKPKRVAIPKNIEPDTVDIALAQKLEELPRTIGNHPEDGLVVKAGIGPYGPYVLHNKIYASIKSMQDVFDISIEDACEKIKEKLSKPKRTKKIPAKKSSPKKSPSKKKKV